MNKKINNYLEFIQFKHTVFALPFALCSYILVSVKIGFQISDLVLILIALVSARIFGMSINRIFDVNIDKKNPRTMNRGLVTGSISFKGAYLMALMSLLIFYLVVDLQEINLLPIIFTFLAAITFPHVIVIEKMYRYKK